MENVTNQLKMRTEELRQVAEDNAKYEEVLEDMELKNKQLTEKVIVLEKKMQRNFGSRNGYRKKNRAPEKEERS